jgi:hypothetical protein
MEQQARGWLFSVFVILSLLMGVDARLATGQESTSSPSGSTHDHSQGQPGSAQSSRMVSFRALPGEILKDEKDIALFPRDLAEGKHWWPTIGVLGVTAGLVASDAHTAPTFRTTTDFRGFNNTFSGVNTGALIAAVPVAIYGVGLLRKDSYAKDTALLAGEGFADGFLLDIPFKGITGRRQPLSYTGNGPYSGSFFNGSHNPVGSGGFYSLHAFAATEIATVVAQRYRRHRWVPYAAYGLAAAISFSRVTRSDHFPADVFFGAAMGYVIPRYVVLPHRN